MNQNDQTKALHVGHETKNAQDDEDLINDLAESMKRV